MLDKLWNKKLNLYKSEINLTVSSCQSVANLEYTTLNFWVSPLHSWAQLDTETQYETQNWINTIGHTDLDTHLETHSYERAIGPWQQTEGQRNVMNLKATYRNFSNTPVRDESHFCHGVVACLPFIVRQTSDFEPRRKMMLVN